MNNGLCFDMERQQDWNASLEDTIASWFALVVGCPGKADIDLRATVELPTLNAAKHAFESNTDLSGIVLCRHGDEAVEMRIPMPLHGVFLSHRQKFQNALVSVWGSW